MRISTGYQYERFSVGMTSAQSRLVEAQEKVQSGKRITRASDDPSATSSLLKMTSVKSAITQYQTNGKTANSSLTTAENTLSDLTDLATQAYGLAVKSGNGTLDQTTIDSIATEIESLQTRLVDLANTEDPAGGYVFGGIQADSKPYTVSNGTLQFSGSTTPRRAEVSADTTVNLGASGQPTVSDLYSRLESLKTSLKGGTIASTATTSIADIQTSLDDINIERANVGLRMDQVEEISTQHDRRLDELTSRITETEDIDIAEAIINYQSAQTAYQASLNVISQGFKYSLQDFIRG